MTFFNVPTEAREEVAFLEPEVQESQLSAEVSPEEDLPEMTMEVLGEIRGNLRDWEAC